MADSNIIPFEPRPPEPVSDTSYEVALDDALTGEIVPVDPPAPPVSKLPVIPINWQTPAGRRTEFARHRAAIVHRAGYHGLRSPGYLVQGAFWAQVGVAKLLYRWLHWWLFPVPAGVHVDAAQEGHRAWKGVFREHKETAKHR